MKTLTKVGIVLIIGIVVSFGIGMIITGSPILHGTTPNACGETIRVYRMVYGTPITGLAIKNGSTTLGVTNSTGYLLLPICQQITVSMVYNGASYTATLYPHQITQTGLP